MASPALGRRPAPPHGLRLARAGDCGAPRRRWRRTLVTRSSDHGRQWQACVPWRTFQAGSHLRVFLRRPWELSGGRIVAPFYGMPAIGRLRRPHRDRGYSSTAACHGAHCPGPRPYKDPSLSCSETICSSCRRTLVVMSPPTLGSLYRAYSEMRAAPGHHSSPPCRPCPAVTCPLRAILCLYRDVHPGQFGVGRESARPRPDLAGGGASLPRPDKDCAYPSRSFCPTARSHALLHLRRAAGQHRSCEIHGVLPARSSVTTFDLLIPAHRHRPPPGHPRPARRRHPRRPASPLSTRACPRGADKVSTLPGCW